MEQWNAAAVVLVITGFLFSSTSPQANGEPHHLGFQSKIVPFFLCVMFLIWLFL
jgi:hypothetical protein